MPQGRAGSTLPAKARRQVRLWVQKLAEKRAFLF